MVTRIHYTKHGIEYVLQYDSTTDTIELRKNRYTLIGGIPNYFRFFQPNLIYSESSAKALSIRAMTSSISTDSRVTSTSVKSPSLK